MRIIHEKFYKCGFYKTNVSDRMKLEYFTWTNIVLCLVIMAACDHLLLGIVKPLSFEKPCIFLAQ